MKGKGVEFGRYMEPSCDGERQGEASAVLSEVRLRPCHLAWSGGWGQK